MKPHAAGFIFVAACASAALVMSCTSRQAMPTPSVSIKTVSAASSQSPFPLILPGETCENIRARYGRESESDPGIQNTWKLDNMSISAGIGKDCIVKDVNYFVGDEHRVTTPDGVVLGEDTIQSTIEKLRSKLAGNEAYVWQGEHQVHAGLDVPPQTGFPYWTTYDWAMSQKKADSITSKREPLMSDFSNETVSSFGIDPHKPVSP
jgi:hypothetical protein